MSYTIDITDCPTGTYAKVRTLLASSAEDYEYDKPVFSFLADADQLAAVQAGIASLDGVSIGGLPSEPAPEVEPEPEAAPEVEIESGPFILQAGDTYAVSVEGEIVASGDIHPRARLESVLAAFAPESGTLTVFRAGEPAHSIEK